MLKFTERRKTPGITSKKTWLSLKGISCLQVFFVLMWMKQTLIWFNLQRDATGNGFSKVNLHQSMCNFKDSLSSSYDVMAAVGKICKEKVPVSDPSQNVETTNNSKLKFT